MALVVVAVFSVLAGPPEAGAQSVEALVKAAKEKRDIDAAYRLWATAFSRGRQAEADAWWKQLTSNAATLMAEAADEKDRAAAEVALAGCQERRAAAGKHPAG